MSDFQVAVSKSGKTYTSPGIVLVDPATGLPTSNDVGAKTDAPATDNTGSWSANSLLKGLLGYLRTLASNPAVVTGTLNATTAAPTTVAGLAAGSFIAIDAGTVDAMTARLAAPSGTATVGWYGTDDDVNLYPLNGLPIGGVVGSGSFANSGSAAGAWSLKGSGARKVYLVATALSASGTIAVKLSATPNQSRITSVLRGSLGGSISAAPGTVPSEVVTIQGIGYRSTATITRPANTTPYTINDVVGGVFEFTNVGPAGGHILITGLDLTLNLTSVPAGMANMRLAFYDATPPSAIADNSVWDLASADRGTFLGYVDVGTPVDLGATAYVQTDPGFSKQFKLATGSTSLWAYLITQGGGYTPAANSEVYTARARAMGL